MTGISSGTIRISVGTAALLGLHNSVPKVPPTTAYLMQGEHCSNSCSFCTQGQDSSSAVSLLSRVSWPEYPLSKAKEALSEAQRKGSLKRVCIQSVSCGDEIHTLVDTVTMIKAAVPDLPLSVSAALDSLKAVERLLHAGADRVNISVDGASREVFESCKKKSWEAAWQLLEKAGEEFPGRIHTHLIAGLGEQEKDITATVQKCIDLNIGVGLFAFTPVKGTPMEHLPQPPLASYRRLQAAVFLQTRKIAREKNFVYDSHGAIQNYGIDEDKLATLLVGGKAFETSGCPGCNRPYYNEGPGQVPYNFPKPLTPEETQQAVAAVLEKGRFLGNARR